MKPSQTATPRAERPADHTIPPSFALHHDAWGRLVLTDDAGQEHVGVEVIRWFPLTAPQHGLSICAPHGQELLWIEALDQLAPSLRQTIEEELQRREFLPIIQRVYSISSPVEPSEWEVETDRGRTRFTLSSAENVRRLRGQAALVVDAHGIRYFIADVRRLDMHSRRLLERFIY